MSLAGHVACTGRRGIHMFLEGKTERTRLLQRLRRRWEDNIKMDLRETGWCGMEWIHLTQNRWAVVNTVMNLRVP
jgi:hypothetical protein